MSKEAVAHDYSEFKSNDPGANAVARLQGLAQDQLAAEALVDSLEKQLKEAKETLNIISEKDIPNLMDELDIEEWSVKDGMKIQVSEKIRGSIPKDNEPKAFKDLETRKLGRLIKRQITIEFGKDQEAWAKKFERDCAQRKKPLLMKVKRSVNPQTLQAWVREQLAEGEDIDLKLYGVYRQRFSKITEPKKKKAKE